MRVAIIIIIGGGGGGGQAVYSSILPEDHFFQFLPGESGRNDHFLEIQY